MKLKLVKKEGNRMRKCSICGGTVTKRIIGMSFFNNTIRVNPIKAEVCNTCGEQFLDIKEVSRVKHKVNTIKEAMQKEHIKEIAITI